MTFKQFDPSTDKLEVGTKIRLGGREGEIVATYPGFFYLHKIRWCYKVFDEDNYENRINLNIFPLLEIADKPPLTIDKRVKEKIASLLDIVDLDISDAEEATTDGRTGVNWDSMVDIRDYLNSLEEV